MGFEIHFVTIWSARADPTHKRVQRVPPYNAVPVTALKKVTALLFASRRRGKIGFPSMDDAANNANFHFQLLPPSMEDGDVLKRTLSRAINELPIASTMQLGALPVGVRPW